MNGPYIPIKIDRAYALARLNNMCETLAAAKGDDRAALLRDYSREMGGYVRDRWLVTREFGSRLWDVAEKCGLVRDMGYQAAQRLFEKSIDEGVKGVIPSSPPSSPLRASVEAVAPPAVIAPAPAVVDPPTSPPVGIVPATPAQNAKEAGSTPAPLSLASVNLEAALGLAHAGNAVFPCGADKRPTFVASWRASSTTNENILREAFERHSAAVPAIDCGKSNLFVIDADRKPDAPDGVAHFEGLCAANNDMLPGVPRVNTPGGGVHYIFSQPEGEPLGNSPGALGGRGIDARGVGGYILAPGATLPDGRRYRHSEGSARLEDGPPPFPPQWLLDKLLAGKPPAAVKHKGDAPREEGASGVGVRPDGLPTSPTSLPMPAPPLAPEQIAHMENIARRSLERIANAPRGTSNDTINREARTLAGLVAAGLPAEGLREHALAVAMERAAKGGNDPHETCKTFDSGWASGRANPLAPDAGMPAEAVEAARASVARMPAGEAARPLHAVGMQDASAQFIAQAPEWPEPKPIRDELLPVPAFDPSFLPDTLRPWIVDIAERMQCALDFVGVSVLIALGSVIGRKVAIRPQRFTDWFEVANLWGCIIGRPGSMKSPAMTEALKPLNKLESVARKENEEALAEFKRAMRVHELKVKAAEKATAKLKADEITGEALAGDTPEPPRMRRNIVTDCTYEALGSVLAHNPNGVLAFRDELVSLLKHLDDERNASARGFYLTAWNGTSGYTFDRIVRGMTHIEATCLSLLGSTQPGRLAEYMRRSQGAGDDGMIQRFGLLIWPDQSGKWRHVDRYPDSDARNKAWETFDRLDQMTPQLVGAEYDDFGGIPFLRFNDAAQRQFDEWHEGLEDRLRSKELPPALESHLAKFRKLVPALALISHLADGGRGPVSEVALLRALSIAEYAEAHARRCYGAGGNADATAAKAIILRIRKGDLKEGFTLRDVHQKDWSNLTDRDQVSAGLDLLVDLDWLAPKTIRSGGRPSTTYSINPRALS